MRLNPDNADIYCNLAIVVWKRSGMRDAVSYFHDAIRLSPRNVTAMYNLAGMLLQEGDCEGAVNWFGKILEIEPGHADAWMYKGNAHFEKDGSIRVVVAHQDPGVKNWIDTCSHEEGTMCWRWYRMPEGAKPIQPACEVVKLKDLTQA